MSKVLFTLLVCSMMLSCGQKDSSVWKVEGKESTIYIGGTIHALRATDYPLPPEFNVAYNLADKLVFEGDLSDQALWNASSQMRLRGTYRDDRTLESVLSKEVYKKLRDECHKRGVKMSSISDYKPVMAMLVLTVRTLEDHGVYDSGVDRHFFMQAIADHKSMGALDNANEVIESVMNIGEGFEDEYVNVTLRNLDQMESRIDELVSAWRTGSEDDMVQWMDDLNASQHPIFKTLILDRNKSWMPKIDALLDDKTVEFILVGTMHLYGPDGVLAMLENEGYVVEKLKI